MEEEQDQFWTGFKIAAWNGLEAKYFLLMLVKKDVRVIMSFKTPTTTT